MLVNTDAERSVIGSLLQSTECQHLLSELTQDDFINDGYRRAFVAMCALRAKKIAIDMATVNIEMGGDSGAMLIEAYRMTPTAVNVGSYSRMVSEATAARTLHNNLRKQADRLAGGMAETDEVADAVRGCLRDGRSSGCLVSIADAAQEAFDEIAEVVSGKRKNIMSGIPLLDSLTNGFRKGEVTLLAAHTGVGKSALAAQIGMNAARCGNEVVLHSLEMSRVQYLKRMYANITEQQQVKLIIRLLQLTILNRRQPPCLL
jgi:replicative DNA helicase